MSPNAFSKYPLISSIQIPCKQLNLKILHGVTLQILHIPESRNLLRNSSNFGVNLGWCGVTGEYSETSLTDEIK